MYQKDQASAPADGNTVLHLFEEQVALTPDNIAVIDGTKEVSYRELSRQTSFAGCLLRSKGIAAGSLVPVCIDRSLEALVGILSILKAGGAYVPISVTHPEEYIRYIVEDTRASIAVSTKTFRHLLPENTGLLDIVDIQELTAGPANEPDTGIGHLSKGTDLAYVIYTSGSTGRPKGVMVEHGNLLYYIENAIRHYIDPQNPATNHFLHLPLTFDASLTSLFLPLAIGHTIVLADHSVVDVFNTRTFRAHQPYHLIKLTPSHIELLQGQADTPISKKTQCLVVGGESLLPHHLRSLTGHYDTIEIVNEYGPTEATVACCIYKFRSDDGMENFKAGIPIGRPLDGAAAYVVDEDMQLVPIGVAGELCIGGKGVTRGYLGKPELTAEKFIENPFEEQTSSTLYRTGDMVRWLSGGQLQFIGRTDHQVKIRGHRVELGEVESVLNEAAFIRQSCVIPKYDLSGSLSLRCFFTIDTMQMQARKKAWELQQVAHWQELYNNQYSKRPGKDADQALDFIGWTDSFSGKEIPVSEMQDWLADIKRLILTDDPGKVLEIGCGTGLIYHSIIDHCSRYTGMDISSAAIDALRRSQAHRQAVEFHACPAHDVFKFIGQEVDTIILNSVIQYFPSIEYLSDIIAAGISKLNGKGRIIIGDIRDYRLLTPFKAKWLMEKEKRSASLEEFGWDVDQLVMKEEELCISPEYFHRLVAAYPGITHIESTWKNSTFDNELTLYRYSVVLYVGIGKPSASLTWNDWQNHGDKEAARAALRSGAPVVALKNAPNTRLKKDILLMEGLTQGQLGTIRELNEYISKDGPETTEMEEMHAMAASLGYKCRRLLQPDRFREDIVLYKDPLDSFLQSSFPAHRDEEDPKMANLPMFSDIAAQLEKEGQAFLTERVPAYMIPGVFQALSHFPLNPNGKIDRNLLLTGDHRSSAEPISPISPMTENERQMVQIWQEYLEIDRVSVNENFFELGGHSLLAVRVISAIRKRLKIEVPLQFFFENPTIRLFIENLDTLRDTGLLPPVTRLAATEDIPLSFAQERLWFIDKLNGSLQYHIPWILRLHGPLDIDALNLAFRSIVQRHEILRTTIEEKDGVGYQVIHPSLDWSSNYHTLEDVYASSGGVSSYISQLIMTPYDFSRDMMLKVNLISIAEDRTVLVVMVHHIAFDGWSISVMIKELSRFYSMFRSQQPTELKALPIQYSDYAIWQRTCLRGDVLEKKLSYWKNKLAGTYPIDMPADFARPPVQSSKGAKLERVIGNDVRQRVRDLCHKEEVTQFMLLMSVFKALLYRYTGHNDICIGTPIAGRQQQEMEGMIGFFVNTLALRTKIDDTDTFKDLLWKVRATAMEAFENQEVPFEKIVEALGGQRDMSRTPIFQIQFALQNTPDNEELLLEELTWEYEENPNIPSRFDINFNIGEIEEGLFVSISYCTDLFLRTTIERLFHHYEILLNAVLADVNTGLYALEMLRPSETSQLLNDFRSPSPVNPPEKTLPESFEYQAMLTPDNTALILEDEEMSYRGLNEQANQLAHFLKERTAPNEMVAICIDRSFEMIIGILGILKAGCAYVPIDIEYPKDRIGFILKDTGCRIAISNRANAHLLDTGENDLQVIEIDGTGYPARGYSKQDLPFRPALTDLIYVIYTSGSTGMPKGVLMEHRSLANFIAHQSRQFHITAGDRILQFYNYCFDPSVEQIFLPLINGATCVLIPETVRKDLDLFENYLHLRKITHLQATPGFLNNVRPGRYGGLKRIIAGGEKCNISLREKWRGICSFYNKYGPTETAITATQYPCPDEATDRTMASLPIGRPVSNTSIYILDKHGNLAPIGIPGEIFIGGIQVARAYLNRPELTVEKFVSDPFSENKEHRLYRTGDFGRWLPDGNIEYIGRKDEQVKIRGFRVELSEIETLISEMENVRYCAVLAIEDASNYRSLVAFIEPSGSFNKSRLVQHLKEKLPAYMVPSVFIEVPDMPLSVSGKINKTVLPAMYGTENKDLVYAAPGSPLEEKMVEIWKQLLEVPAVGVKDNFFELGGHSLLAARVISKMRKDLGIDVSLTAFFNDPTIAGLAALDSNDDKAIAMPAITTMQRLEKTPLSYSQERLWFIDRLHGSTQYHMPWIFELKGSLDATALNFSFREILHRHEVLRTNILSAGGIPYQDIDPAKSWNLQYFRQNELKDDDAIRDYLEKEMTRPYDLSADVILRVSLIQKEEKHHILFVMVHHISFDGWSVALMVKELQELYSSFLEKRSAVLPQLPFQYADYAIWQRSYMDTDVYREVAAYWSEQMKDLRPLDLPCDFTRPAEQSIHGNQTSARLTKKCLSDLENLSHREGTTLFMTMLAAFKVLMYKYSGQNDICIGTAIAGRDEPDLEHLIGFFVNTLPLRSVLSGSDTFLEFLRSVKQVCLQGYEHQHTPFEKIVEYAGVDRDMSRSPLFQIMFVLQNTPAAGEPLLGDVRMELMEMPVTTSRFDLDISVRRLEDGIDISVAYCSDLFKKDTVDRMLTHYENILHAIILDPASGIDGLESISSAEKDRILSTFNPTGPLTMPPASIIQMFEEQVRMSGNRTSVSMEEQDISYEQLNSRANQLAHYLIKKGVGKDVPVPVCFSRSIELIIGLLAILKAGGAYMPLDPEYPAERIAYMLEHSQAAIIVGNTEGLAVLPAIDQGIGIIDLIRDQPLFCQEDTVNPKISADPKSLFYVLYTSGSTGRPKGVMLEDQALANLLIWHHAQSSAQDPRRILQFASMNFDVSFHEIFSALCFGGSLVLIDEDRRKDMGEMLKTIAANGVTHLFIPNIVLHGLCQHAVETRFFPRSLSKVFCAGEQLKLNNDLRVFFERTGADLLNYYGPSETHVVSSYKVSLKDYSGSNLPPIGKPILNTRLYILTSDRKICGIGVPGELYAGGIQLARGYWNNQTLTDEKFIHLPAVDPLNSRLYRTGDLAKWLPDGNIEFLGRNDDQVKIKGIRVELGEIETILTECGLVKQAVVTFFKDRSGTPALAAYIVPGEMFDKTAVVAYLKRRLPDHMVPNHLIRLEKIPVTVNGKVDRPALPSPILTDVAEAYTPPQTHLERSLAAIWEKVLPVSPIGIHDNFFSLGGHSLLSTRIVTSIAAELSINITIKDIFRYPTIAELAIYMESLEEKGAPLSFSQERMWFIHRHEGSLHYHIPIVVGLEGELNEMTLERSFRQILKRHKVLRTVVKEENGKPFQIVRDEMGWELRRHREEVGNEYTDTIIRQLIDTPFDLEQDYMLRADLIQRSNDKRLLVITIHHIATDGWSMHIILKELMELYAAGSNGRRSVLPEMPVQYADYARQQKKLFEEGIMLEKLAYWQKALSDLPVLDLPTDFPRPSRPGYTGGITSWSLDQRLAARLKQLGIRNGATPFMLLLSVFKILLSRYSGQKDISVGSPLAGRNKKEWESLVGCFVGTVVLRSRIRPGMTFLQLLEDVKEATLTAHDNQDAPFEKVVSTVIKDRAAGRNPLFQVFFSTQHQAAAASHRLGEVTLTEISHEQKFSKFDLSLIVTESIDGTNMSMEYSTDLFEKGTIDRMFHHYVNLLTSVIQNPEAPVDELKMLGTEEMELILDNFNSSECDYDLKKNIVQLFEEQVALTPHLTAIEYHNGRLSYKELNSQCNRLARYLQGKGVKEDTPVPVYLGIGIQRVIAVLSVLKAGGAFVPLDPEHPGRRTEHMLKEMGSLPVLLTGSLSPADSGDARFTSRINLDTDWKYIDKESEDDLDKKPALNSLAYIMYTSGSTGRPKGVMIEHKSLVNYLLFCKTQYVDPGSDNARTFVHLPYTFDASVTAVFLPLITGGMLVLASNTSVNVFKDPAFTSNAPYEFIKLTPDHALLLEEAARGRNNMTRRLIFGGSALHYDHLQSLLDSNEDLQIINEYGPTEATVGACIYNVPGRRPAPRTSGGVPIGRPIGHTWIYILDDKMAVQPIGVWGEMYIGGAGLARGYLHQPNLTKENFIQDPFKPDTLIYRTGDIGRWSPGGIIEYRGRKDDQIKIGGHRIEPGEVEVVLKSIPGIVQAVVLVKADDAGALFLEAYVVLDKTNNKKEIRHLLPDLLPAYMIPKNIVEVDGIPLNTHGKVDKSALTGKARIISRKETVGNDLECLIMEVWQQLLGVDNIGLEDNFFQLGGDSIISIQVASRLRKMGYPIEINDMFESGTIKHIAAVVAGRNRSGSMEEDVQPLEGECGLLPIQQWFLDSGQHNYDHFNQSVLLGIRKGIDEEALNKIFQSLYKHHDALRFNYSREQGQWRQTYTNTNLKITINDLSKYTGEELDKEIKAIADALQKSFCITDGPLVRVSLVRTSVTSETDRLLMIIHHLVIDGVSWRILIEDLEHLLDQWQTGENIDPGKRTGSYRKWHEGLRAYGQTARLTDQLDYWKSIEQAKEIPLDFPAPRIMPVTIRDLNSHEHTLPKDLTYDLLHNAHHTYRTEVNDLLLSALLLAFKKTFGLHTLSIGLEGHGRDERITKGIDLSRTIGWFTIIYPVTLHISQDDRPGEIIKHVKEQLRMVPDGGIGYSVLKYINREAALDKADPWEVVFNYLGQADNIISASKWLSEAHEPTGQHNDSGNHVSEKISVNAIVVGGQVLLNWRYSKHHFKESTIVALADCFASCMKDIVADCLIQQRSGIQYTPSDFGLSKEVTYPELDAFLDESLEGLSRRQLITGLYRLNSLQNGVLFHGLYSWQVEAYIEQFICDLADLDTDAFLSSWQTLIRHHSILRTAFYHDRFSVPVQCVYKQVDLPFRVIDLRNVPSAELPSVLKEFEAKDRKTGFDFTKAPLMRITLLCTGQGQYRMVWSHHHILTDGWSMQVIMEEFLNTYDAITSGNTPALKPDDKFEDYIRFLESRNKDEQKEYWRNYLGGITAGTLLPFTTLMVERNKGIGEYRSLTLGFDDKITARIREMAGQLHITVNTVMQGVWSFLLHQYTGVQKVVFGIVVSGRPEDLPGVEERVGMYINTIPLSAKISRERIISGWLQQLQQDQAGAMAHQYISILSVRNWLNIPGDLFDSLLVYENYPLSEMINSKKWNLKVDNMEVHEHTNYPLCVTVGEREKINVHFGYNSDIIDHRYIEVIKEHFENILLQILDRPSDVLGNLQLLPPSQQQKVLTIFNETEMRAPGYKTFIAAFEYNAIRFPDYTAIATGRESISFRELNARCNRLAHYLIGVGIKRHKLVPIMTERSPEMIIGIIAILKAGGAYVPLDTKYPSERIDYILNDLGYGIILTDETNDSKIDKACPVVRINLDKDKDKIAMYPDNDPEKIITGDDLAYVIYTSGSSGRPKGVQVRHAAFMNYLANARRLYITKNPGAEGSGSFLHLSNAFDASLTEIFVPLYACRCIVISTADSGKILQDALIKDHAPYDFIKFTPGHLPLINASLAGKRLSFYTGKIILGGEALFRTHLEFLKDELENITIYNEYGPTESTVGCCVYTFQSSGISDLTVENIPIGKPIGNVKLYVLNEYDEPMPVGVPGQLLIGGQQLAAGYLNLPELTAEKFIDDPFNEGQDSKLYKTGDLARWLPDGNLEFLGRLDDQMKINGYRVEPGEIEHLITTVPGVKMAKALAIRDMAPGLEELVGFAAIDRDIYPLLYDLLAINEQNSLSDTEFHVMPNGLPVFGKNRSEILFLFREIFGEGSYGKHSIPLRSGDVIVDIGANVGFFSIFINLLYPGLKTYAIEPAPEVFNSLKNNIALYGLDARIFQMAISDTTGEIAFTYYPQVSVVSGVGSDKTLVKKAIRKYLETTDTTTLNNWEIDALLDAKLESKEIRCPAKQLSHFIKEEKITRIDLLKIDVENSEEMVLNGISEEDWPGIRNIIIEVNDIDGRLDRIREKLIKKGFNVYTEKENILSNDDTFFNIFALSHRAASDLDYIDYDFPDIASKWIHPDDLRTAILNKLQQSLPGYMTPCDILFSTEFPLTTNGKLDQARLIRNFKDNNHRAAETAHLPVNEVELKLIAIWQRILDVDEVGMHDDFFKLGGDSLQALRIISAVTREIFELPVNVFFKLITIKDIAKYLSVQLAAVQPDNVEYEIIDL